MANKEEKISKPLSFDVIIEKRKEDSPEVFQNDFDDFLITNKKKLSQKKLYFSLLFY